MRVLEAVVAGCSSVARHINGRNELVITVHHVGGPVEIRHQREPGRLVNVDVAWLRQEAPSLHCRAVVLSIKLGTSELWIRYGWCMQKAQQVI